MKKIYGFMMLLFVATMSLGLTSCNSNDDDNQMNVTVSDLLDADSEYKFYVLVTQGPKEVKWWNIYKHNEDGTVNSYSQRYECSSEAVALEQLAAIERTEDMLEVRRNGNIIYVSFDSKNYEGLTLKDITLVYDMTKAQIYKYYGQE